MIDDQECPNCRWLTLERAALTIEITALRHELREREDKLQAVLDVVERQAPDLYAAMKATPAVAAHVKKTA